MTGNVVVRLPLPPGCFTTLWKNDADFVTTYFSAYPGCYLTSDAGFIDEDGYLWIMGRTDDIINVAGDRLSTGAMEEVLASHLMLSNVPSPASTIRSKGRYRLALFS